MQDVNEFLQKLSIVMREDLVIKKPDWFENLCKTVNEKILSCIADIKFSENSCCDEADLERYCGY